MKTPKIGITLDHEIVKTYSQFPWYALRENYCSSISYLGAIPLPLPHELMLVEHYVGLIDGLIVTGGAFDISPALYGNTTAHETVTTKDTRTQFEWAMTQAMLKRNKPVLGICGGQQLLNVVLGGTLIQHIPDTVQNALEHEQKNPRNEPGHTVRIAQDTRLHKIVCADELNVNSAHHQAVDQVAPGAIINATAPDGVIEGIEHPAYKFCLGVQWHPEFLITDGDRSIFEAFVAAARS